MLLSDYINVELLVANNVIQGPTTLFRLLPEYFMLDIF